MFGGGFQGGANIQYPGHFLAAKGVIVVVPNYRLGAFGKNIFFMCDNKNHRFNGNVEV